MSSLVSAIKQHYSDNLSALPLDKQFHFASRIAAWEGDPTAYTTLEDLRTFMVGNGPGEVPKILRNLASKPQAGRRNAHELRQPFFKKYPLLWNAHSVLFRVRHLITIYGVDAREDFFRIFKRSELDELANRLIEDKDALRILSTFAVNFLYLYKKVVLEDGDSINPELFLEAANSYDLNNKHHLQLIIYLFTHSIIGDSNFYTQQVSSANKRVYETMLKKLEELISANFQDINLDNKLEYLVCARICDYASTLFEKTEQECKNSISSEGHFLIDTHNTHGQDDRKSFEKSEHRNVLYIMSTSPYNPHSALLSK